jgi:flagellar basal-body rod protein FlgB
MSGRLTESIDFHGRALLLRAERQKMLASNIANADTPGYAARDFDFRAALAEATGRSPGSAPSAAATGSAESTAGPPPRATAVAATHPGHLGGGTAPGRVDATAMRYRVVEQPSLDANTVDLDRERANFADNAVRYEAGLRFINGSVRTLLSAIRGE